MSVIPMNSSNWQHSFPFHNSGIAIFISVSDN